ncbi:MAG TPA: hypothetical protein VJT72_04060, partial [Pseudonocardiaceae bacterium]|nr:hypothetical protein [Pseudonocardiaceae bacterium]
TRTAHQADLAAIPRQRPPARIVVGGPGWRDRELPAAVTRAATLAEAVQRLGPPPHRAPVSSYPSYSVSPSTVPGDRP